MKLYQDYLKANPDGGRLRPGRPASQAGHTRSLQIDLGYERQGPEQTGAPVDVDCSKPFLSTVLSGANGAGKQTRILTRLCMTWQENLIFLGAKGTACFQTGAARSRFSDCATIAPHPLLGLKSDKFNPIANLRPKHKDFISGLLATAKAIVDPEPGIAAHFSRSAVMLGAVAAGWLCYRADAEKTVPFLPDLRSIITAPDIFDQSPTKRRRAVAGFTHTMQKVVECNHPGLASLAGRFVRSHGLDELSGIVSTLDTNAELFLDPNIQELMRGPGIDVANLCDAERPQTIYYEMAPDRMVDNKVLSRLLVSAIMRAHFRPGRRKTLIVADEFPVTVGKLDIVRENWSIIREFNLAFLPVVQSLMMFRDLWGDRWESLIGQAGAIVQLGPPADTESAEFLSRRSGVTTIPVLGYNEGGGGNAGGNDGYGSGVSGSGFSSNHNAGTSYGRSFNAGFSISQTERRALLPQDLMDMRPGDGRVWFQGMGSRSVPFFAPHYFGQRAEWAARVRKNPYYHEA